MDTYSEAHYSWVLDQCPPPDCQRVTDFVGEGLEEGLEGGNKAVRTKASISATSHTKRGGKHESDVLKRCFRGLGNPKNQKLSYEKARIKGRFLKNNEV